jgi:hypothetical protein
MAVIITDGDHTIGGLIGAVLPVMGTPTAPGTERAGNHMVARLPLAMDAIPAVMADQGVNSLIRFRKIKPGCHLGRCHGLPFKKAWHP